MSDIRTSTVSEDGFARASQVGGFDLQIDVTGETGPNPDAALVAAYASCFLPAFRVDGQKTDFDDLGKVRIDANADLDGNDDLECISFDVYVESGLSDDEFAEIIELAGDICRVHDALRDESQADVTVVGDASQASLVNAPTHTHSFRRNQRRQWRVSPQT